MPKTGTVDNVVRAEGLSKRFPRKFQSPLTALDGVSLTLPKGTLTALVGPDGAGKTTLIRLICGLFHPDAGTLNVLGLEMPGKAAQVQARISYMPQKFGLYEDLTVRENLDLYAEMHGVDHAVRKQRYERLLAMTALAPFTERPAGRLSGGMKQKLGLACTLVRLPELLVLDEPTVGVDPLSRRELWNIIHKLVREENLTVLVSTAYMDEAAGCGNVIVMREGKIVVQGTPAEIADRAAGRSHIAIPPDGMRARDFQAKLSDRPDVTDAVPEGGRVRFVTKTAGSLAGFPASAVNPRLEDGFMCILHDAAGENAALQSGLKTEAAKPSGTPEDVVIEVSHLLRRFGKFTAVNHINFKVHRGEVFGLLGPNGAGKTTTFRMLCGLLPASGGHLQVAGMDMRRARADARGKVGYVAQKFSLYGQLSVMENLEFFARAYGLHGVRKSTRIQWVADSFELGSLFKTRAMDLPGGIRQRLAMAAALMHEPEILFLDEPTSGADPLARREFWRRITALSAQGVTVVVTTHFMEEAEYCDHIVIMDAGQILARGTPAEVRRNAASMEEAFIAIVEQARQEKEAAKR